MINDNLGIILAGHFQPTNTGLRTTSQPIKDTAGFSGIVNIYSPNATTRYNDQNSALADTQVGTGTTPPTRQDLNIENEFASSPEKDKTSCNTVGYIDGSGLVVMPCLISPTTGSGSITEVCHFAKWVLTGSNGLFLITRDVISPVGFIGGENINVDIEVLI